MTTHYIILDTEKEFKDLNKKLHDKLNLSDVEQYASMKKGEKNEAKDKYPMPVEDYLKNWFESEGYTLYEASKKDTWYGEDDIETRPIEILGEKGKETPIEREEEEVKEEKEVEEEKLEDTTKEKRKRTFLEIIIDFIMRIWRIILNFFK